MVFLFDKKGLEVSQTPSPLNILSVLSILKRSNVPMS
jgi:hypothetical protein